MQVVIKGGQIVTQKQVFKGNILIEDGKIKQVGKNFSEKKAQVFNASGLTILPGLIDIHVHLRDPGATYKEDFYTGTSAALAGGVTTIIDMPNNSPSVDSKKSLREKIAVARAKSVCDYQFYIGATPTNQEGAVGVASKVVGMKLYMGSSTGDLLVADEEPLLKHFQRFPREKPIMLHCEDEELIKLFLRVPGTSHNEHRPPITAAAALAKALEFARFTNRRIHICHLSTEREIELICQAKKTGINVTCEVTPHHLFLSKEDQRRLKNFVKMNPPLRSKKDKQALWNNLDFIDVVATDHAPHTLDEKTKIYQKAPSGVPGIETLLPLLLKAISNKKLTLIELARLTSFNPAKIAGLKNKGEIKIGNDADLTLVDLNKTFTIRNKDLRTKCGWTPFDGWKVRGKIVATFLRGKPAYKDGKILVPAGFGRLVPFN